MLIQQGKINWGYLVIVFILTILVGAGTLYLSNEIINEETNIQTFNIKKIQKFEIGELKHSLEYELKFCENAEQSSEREDCYLYLALITAYEEICENISDDYGYATYCQAVVNKDPEMCSNIQEKSKQDYCVAVVERNSLKCEGENIKSLKDCYAALSLHNSVLDKDNSVCNSIPSKIEGDYNREVCSDFYDKMILSYFNQDKGILTLEDKLKICEQETDSTMKSDCYFKLAFWLNNKEICNNMRGLEKVTEEITKLADFCSVIIEKDKLKCDTVSGIIFEEVDRKDFCTKYLNEDPNFKDSKEILSYWLFKALEEHNEVLCFNIADEELQRSCIKEVAEARAKWGN